MADGNMIVSVSPHIHAPVTTRRIMLDVIIALMPAFIASIIVFGARSILIVCVCVAACVLSEFLYCKIVRKENTIGDLSAIVTGILLAFNLPVGIHVWQAVIGSAVAIVVVKQLFGGIGKNFANPAITARIVLHDELGHTRRHHRRNAPGAHRHRQNGRAAVHRQYAAGHARRLPG